MNKIGPRTEPRGTPCMLINGGDNEELIFTEYVLDETIYINQLWT